MKLTFSIYTFCSKALFLQSVFSHIYDFGETSNKGKPCLTSWGYNHFTPHSGLSSLSSKREVQRLTSIPVSVILFGNRVFADIIKDLEMRSICSRMGLKSHNKCPLKRNEREIRGTGTQGKIKTKAEMETCSLKPGHAKSASRFQKLTERHGMDSASEPQKTLTMLTP